MIKPTFIRVSKILLPIIFVASAVSPNIAIAIDPDTQMNGLSFSNACKRAEEGWVSFCNGYIQAVVDGISKGQSICIPVGTTRTDLVTISEREITGSSELKSLNAHQAVLSVLLRNYPCK